ncbi:CGNR zinc finger domain-containing protein [Phytomonospora sp. NPDC050363]|uniref:CGNR zinc finger domain-containing protein n=1 Tax=Phytomonospora sp. NPDC050363 TaxID=3155642 RepID=UPI00340EDEDD
MSTGFQPARRLVDLANLVHSRPAATRCDFVAVLAEHGERSADLVDSALTDGDLDELRAAVVRLTGLLAESDVDEAARVVNEVLAGSGARPRLSRHDGHPWHLHVDGEDAGWGDWLLASSALSLAQLLSERGRPAWGRCPMDGCAAPYFIDDGPGSPRRYCSTTCASRARVAAYRQRKREQAAE